MAISDELTFGILTVSDSCFEKTKPDLSGPKLEAAIQRLFPEAKVVLKSIVPDETHHIANKLQEWVLQRCNVILTTGGTGFAPRDVTPEATRLVIEKEAPGLAYAMITKSLAVTDMAMLSREVCGIKNETLIVNLPGSVKGAVECFGFISGTILHAVSLITNNLHSVTKEHDKLDSDRKEHHKFEETPSKVKQLVTKRDRVSPYPLIEVNDVYNIIQKECSPTVLKEEIQIDRALNRVLAENIYAKTPIPQLPTSTMDGYAIKASNTYGEKNVRQAIVAGDVEVENDFVLGCHDVVRISTGAPVPPGADAVVPVEETVLVEASSDGTEEIKISYDKAYPAGSNIRQIGSDVPKDSLVFKIGERILAAHLGVLTSLGISRVKVYRRASVGILSTGNEIVPIGQNLLPGQIYDSNKITLINLLNTYGGYQASDCGIAKDTPDRVKFALQEAFAKHDMVVSSGGVSMGEFDVVKKVLVEDFGATIHVGRVNMKPGKPTTFASLSYNEQTKYFFGLPGNPVSASVTCLLFVLTTLKYLERSKMLYLPTVRARYEGILVKGDGRPEYLRVNLQRSDSNIPFVAKATGSQMSSRLNSLVNANGLLFYTGNVQETYNTLLLNDNF